MFLPDNLFSCFTVLHCCKAIFVTVYITVVSAIYLEGWGRGWGRLEWLFTRNHLYFVCMLFRKSRYVVLFRLEFWNTVVLIMWTMWISLINIWIMPFDTTCNIILSSVKNVYDGRELNPQLGSSLIYRSSFSVWLRFKRQGFMLRYRR